MRKYFFLFLLLFFPYLLSAETVTNVRAMQEGKKIVVLYDLSEDTYVSKIIIEVDGKSRVIPNKFLKGDVNKDLKAGVDKRVEYDVLADYVDGFKSDNVVFVIEQGGIYAVDLGLSVKWATCNVGATTPEEYGDYFAWGEVEPKTTYNWSTYKYCNGSSSTLTKYCNNSSYGSNGFTDNKTVLDPEDDAATVNWGGSWRMPTKAEQDELRNNCTWKWTTQKGVKGYKVTGPNGNSIFLPAAGYMREGALGAGSYGDYWSSSLDAGSPNDAYDVGFRSDYVGWGYYYRYFGLAVRPVCL